MESTPQSVASVPAQRLRTLLWTRPWLSGACCVQRPVPDTSASGPVHHGADVTPQGPAASASPFWASSCPERLLLSPSGTADASGLAPTPSVNGGGGGGGVLGGSGGGGGVAGGADSGKPGADVVDLTLDSSSSSEEEEDEDEEDEDEDAPRPKRRCPFQKGLVSAC